MDNDVIDLSGPPDRSADRRSWRNPLAIGLAMAFVIVCTGLTLAYRHAQQDRWVTGTVAWQDFDVSSDGRTLTFHLFDVGQCTRITGVDFSTDPTAGGVLTATVETRTQIEKEGHPVFCNLAAAVGGSSRVVRFDRPVPDGTVVTDGAMLPLASSCPRSQQIVRTPTHVGPGPYGCAAVG